MALTHQADAKSITKRVRRMLLDLNLTSEGGARVGGVGRNTARRSNFRGDSCRDLARQRRAWEWVCL
jgi:hypothetical protein